MVPLHDDDILKTDPSIFANIIANLPGYIYWKNTKSVYMGCNNNLAKESGLKSSNDIIGKTDHDFYWGQQAADMYVMDDREVMQSGVKKITEYKIPSAISEKRYRYIRTEKSPLYYDNQVIGVLAVAVDITTEKEAEALKLENEANKRKIELMKTLAASLAHELRTPLAAINMAADGTKNYLHILVDTYNKAKDANIPVEYIHHFALQTLPSVFDDIRAETNFANTIVNMMIVKAQHTGLETIALEVCSIKQCIIEALRRYPFSPSEKSLIQWNDQTDFLLKGNEQLTIHILFNLLKNALYYVKAAGKGNINIWLELGDSYNKLFFQDTGMGIAANILPRIFECFFTATYHGSGVGLSFCQMVMKSYGGDITCNAVEGEYTKFTLIFPIVGVLPLTE